MNADRELLYQHVEFLTTLRPFRNHKNLESLERVCNYLKDEFRKYGLEPTEQKFPVKAVPEGAQLVAIEVNGKETLLDGKTVGEAASLIRGPVGTELDLTVVPSKNDTAIKVRLIRAPLEIAGASATTYKSFIGKPMPILKLTSRDGTRSSQVADYRGKVVVLDFWASWCPTCYPPVTRMQILLADNPRWKGKVKLMIVTVDSDLAKAVAVVEKKKWNNSLNCAVNIEELNAIGVSVIPLVIVIARDGTIATMAGAHALDIEKEVVALLER